MSRVIVSVATGPRFCGGMRRLRDCLNELGEVFSFYEDCFPHGSPDHLQVPYGFKVYAMAQSVPFHLTTMWLDSSVVPIKPLDPIWELVESQGYWFSQNYDYTVGQFCCDEALQIMQLSREEAHSIPLVIGTAFALGFWNNTALEFYNEWKRLMQAGAFNGPWTTHRHDQTVASVVCHRLGMKLTQPPKFIVEDFQAPTEETVFTICR